MVNASTCDRSNIMRSYMRSWIDYFITSNNMDEWSTIFRRDLKVRQSWSLWYVLYIYIYPVLNPVFHRIKLKFCSIEFYQKKFCSIEVHLSIYLYICSLDKTDLNNAENNYFERVEDKSYVQEINGGDSNGPI